MPILDLQRKMAESGRIRMGEKKPGEKFPRKLETFRLTSRRADLIEQAAAEWGGTVEPWESPNGPQWQVVTEAKVIDIVLLPAGMAFSQWRELWSGGGCQRRCDGVTETISDQPCVCDPDPARRECKDTTRLSVLLPDLAGAGLWRLESHGYYAATEIAGTLEVVANLAPGMLAKGTLTADPRSAKRFKADGSPVTNRYIVPVIDLPELRLKDRMIDQGDGVSVAIETRSPGLTAVPELPEGPRQTIAEQLADQPEPRAKRSNAAAELPATGLKPAGAPPDPDAVGDDVGDDVEDAVVVDDSAVPEGWANRNKKLQAEVHEIWKGESASFIDKRRKALIQMASEAGETSSKKLTDEEWSDVFVATADLLAGRTELFLRAAGDFEIRPLRGDPVPPAAARAADGMTLPSSTDEWKALIARAGVKQVDVIREAQRLAGQGGPGSLTSLVGHEVAEHVLAWLHQQAAA